MDLDALVSDAQARIAAADGSAALEEVRIDVLGRKAPLVLALRELGSLDPEERRTRGADLNRSRQVTDTFYVSDDVVLRTHTSPVRIRTMEAQPPPVHMATAGRCYRRDT